MEIVSKTYWIPLTIKTWDNLEVSITGPFAHRLDNSELLKIGCCGFIPAYEHKEDAERQHPNDRLVELQATGEEDDSDAVH